MIEVYNETNSDAFIDDIKNVLNIGLKYMDVCNSYISVVIVDKETILYYKEKADSYEECKQCQVKPECIRLKHCVFQQSRCNSFIKKRFYRRIERSVINTYLLYLKTRRKYN